MTKSRLLKVIALVLTVVFMVAVFAGCATTTTTTDGETTSSTGGSWTMIIMLVVMVAIFYFLLIRPENKKKKQAEELRSSITAGDTITTIGGIVGRVVAVQGDFIVFETSEDRVRIKVAKWAISTKGKQAEEETK